MAIIELTELEKAGRDRILNDTEYFAEKFLKIRDKSGVLMPLTFNRAQKYLHAQLEDQKASTGKVRALGLKGRQQGFSTYIAARFFHKVALREGRRAFIMAHEAKASNNLFTMSKRFYEHLPAVLRHPLSATNAQELEFAGEDSGYKVVTAGSQDTGRSATSQLLHGCLSPDTWIVDGVTGSLRRMGDFKIGDVVRTHTGEIALVSAISRQKKIARSVVMKGMGQTPLIATDEHRFWTREGWKCLRDIRVGDEIGFPVAQITDGGISWAFRLPDSVRPQGGGSRETGPDCVSPDYNLGRVLGLYLAEGCINKQSKTKVPSAVTFAVHEREVGRTVEWLDAVPGLFVSAKVAPRVDSKTVTVTAYGRSFASFVRAQCGELDSKRLPDQWRSCGAEFVRGLVQGYLAGDGHSSTKPGDRRISAPSIRSAITVGMRDALASLGYGWACIGWRDGAKRNGRNERAQWTLRLSGSGVDQLTEEIGWSMPPRQRKGRGEVEVSGDYAWVPVRSISDAGEVDVMDFEVAHEDHSYCAMQGATHNSEVAFWANASTHLAGIGNTVADLPGTEIILESTGNGVGGGFHSLWQKAEMGEGEYIPIFVPWSWQDEYRAEVKGTLDLDEHDELYKETYGLDLNQMQWRANKIATYEQGLEWLFDQEYPAVPALAFQTPTRNPLISPTIVQRAVNSGYATRQGAFVIGCDPAEGVNRDRTAIVFRTGRVVWRTESHSDIDTMEAAGLLAKYFQEFQPDAIIVDRIGIGSGMVSRLRELNVPVIGVHSGEKAREPDIYLNKRAEMWWEMLDWLKDTPCRIPNDPGLISDLSAPGIKLHSSSRKQLESKESMANRDVRSPDIGDALALTFAEPVQPRNASAMMVRNAESGHPSATRSGY